MATKGNNFSKKVAEARDASLESFDKDYLDAVRGQDTLSKMEHYIGRKKYNKQKNKIKNNFNNMTGEELLKYAQEMDNKTLTGELSAEEIESAVIATLDAIEDAHMVKDEELTK